MNEERQALIDRILGSFIIFNQTKTLLERLEAIYVQEPLGVEPRQLMIVGEPGVGKTSVLQRFVRSHPVVDRGGFTEIPVVYAEVPSHCTPKILPGEVLRAMGSPFWNKGDPRERTDQLETLLKACRLRTVILDEVNHLVQRGGVKTHYGLGDWIKSTSTRTVVPFVLSGTKKARQLLQVNAQLRSRWREVIEIEPLACATTAQQRDAQAAMKAFARLLGDVDRIDMASPDLTRRLVMATQGRLRELRNLIIRWIECAPIEGDFKLDLRSLSLAFESAIFPGAPPTRNPFADKFDGEPLTGPGEPYEPE